MELKVLGFRESYIKEIDERGISDFSIGRVSAEHKERYELISENGDYEAELIGNLRFNAESREDLPAVGDWVMFSEYDDGKALIHAVLKRSSIISRRAVSGNTEKQIIASNIDFAFIVQAVDRDFNVNRIERYLTICYDGKVEPVVILNKIDLISKDDLERILENVKSRVKDIPVFAISNETKHGHDEVKEFLCAGKTYCLLGSSGVGKSTLLNNLSGKELMDTGNISDSTNKGRHVTTYRQLVLLESGAMFIDNPGMREVGIADFGEGMEKTFDLILDYAEDCKYSDCTHTSESGCAVIEAVESGEIDAAVYENYLRMKREEEHYESSALERKNKQKDLAKVIKNFKKIKKFRRT